MKYGTCKLCGYYKLLVRESHILPKSFYKAIFRNNGINDFRVYTLDNGMPSPGKRSPTGIYDEYILCKKCENSIGVFDNYGRQLILNYYIYSGVDFEKFKLFILSLIFRAHLSKHDIYAQVHLGGLFKEFRNMVYTREVSTFLNFPICVMEFEEMGKPAIFAPIILKEDGVRSYVWVIGKWAIQCIVSKNPERLNIKYNELSLQEDGLLPAIPLYESAFNYMRRKLRGR